MNSKSSRRNFLAAGLSLPAAGMASTSHRPADSAGASFVKIAAGDPPLRYRTLGKTGLKITEVGFGCMVTSDATVVEAAAEIGINFFDTARVYQGGNNERMVGQALKPYRDRIVLCSKTKSESKAECMADLETSLKELGTDHLDILYLHSKAKSSDITDGMLEALELAKKQGKIRFGGFSTHSGQKELLAAWQDRPEIDVILVAYNFTMDEEMKNAVAGARKAGKGIVAMKVMAGGFRKVKPGDPLYDKFNKDGTMLAALRWVLDDRNVDVTIPSITDMEQLDENLKAMSGGLGAEDRRLLATQLEHIKPLYCRMCGTCAGRCPKGLPVSDMIRYLSYAEGYGQFSLGRENFLRLPEELQAVRCADCDECVIECPNGVRIAERLTRAQEVFA